jgi:hypothetical protein
MRALIAAFLVLCCAPLSFGQANPAAARARWGAKAWELRELNEDAFMTAARALQQTPHARAETVSSGSSISAPRWYGRAVQVDEDWWLVREVINPPANGFPPPDAAARVTVVGFPDLRPQVQPELYEALRAIHRCPSVFGISSAEQLDPVLIVRAVNTLQAVGEERALAAMRAYAALPSRTVLTSRWHEIDRYRLIVLARLLYPSAGQPIRAPWIGAPSVCFRPGTDAAALSPLVLRDDLPFVLSTGYSGTGMPEDPLAYLEECRAHGKFLSKPLAPTGNVIGTAESLLASLPKDACEESMGLAKHEIELLVRAQAAAALATIPAAEQAHPSPLSKFSDAQWFQLSSLATDLAVAWDAGDRTSPRRSDQPLHRCAIGTRRPEPKATVVTLRPTAACLRLYSARSTSLATFRTTSRL